MKFALILALATLSSLSFAQSHGEQKSRNGKTLIFDIQVGGRVRNPYFKVTIEKGEHACEFKSLLQDQARG